VYPPHLAADRHRAHPNHPDARQATLEAALEMLERIDARLRRLEANLAPLKSWMTATEFAGAVNKSAYTVREWCKAGRIGAEFLKDEGRTGEWRIPANELDRYRREGLRPRTVV
jgi:hypothetical protein